MAFEAWLVLNLYSECCLRTLNRKEQLRHRAVSLRSHGFLVNIYFVKKCLAKFFFVICSCSNFHLTEIVLLSCNFSYQVFNFNTDHHYRKRSF